MRKDRGVRYSKLHEKRADAIISSYALLAKAQRVLKTTADPQPGTEAIRKRHALFGKCANAFFEHFDDHRILFAEPVITAFDAYWNKLTVAGYMQLDKFHWPQRHHEDDEAQLRAINTEELPEVRRAFETQYRKLLGVTQRPKPGPDFWSKARWHVRAFFTGETTNPL